MNDENREALLAQVGTLFLGVLLVLQGVGKFADWGGYLSALGAFGLFPEGGVYDAATVWAIGEVVGGALLVGGIVGTAPEPRIRKMGAVVAMVIGLAYFLLTSQAYLRGLPISNCTCFGTFLPQPLSPFVMAQDVVIVVWAGWELKKARNLLHS